MLPDLKAQNIPCHRKWDMAETCRCCGRIQSGLGTTRENYMVTVAHADLYVPILTAHFGLLHVNLGQRTMCTIVEILRQPSNMCTKVARDGVKHCAFVTNGARKRIS
jgi:hypothetical protein